MKIKFFLLLSGLIVITGCGDSASPASNGSSNLPVIPDTVGQDWQATNPENQEQEEQTPSDEIGVLIEALGKADWRTRDDATKKLIKMGDSIMDRLLVAIRHKDRDVRKNTAWILGELADDRAVDALIAALKDTSVDVRAYAAQALGKVGNTRAIVPLNRAKHDTSKDVRKMAVKAVEMIRQSARYMPPVDDTALEDPEPKTDPEPGDTQENTATAEKPETVPEKEPEPPAEELVLKLLKKLESPDPRSKYDAALQFALIRDKRAVEPLIKLLGDESSFVRQAAAKALGSIGDKSAVSHLTRAMNDPEEIVRNAAKAAIEKLK